jgi:dUTP pyrophosphatase
MTQLDDRVLKIYNSVRNSFVGVSNNFAILKLLVNPNNNNLKALYQEKVELHNNKIVNNHYLDSGFDLFVPTNIIFNQDITTEFIDFQVKAEMIYCDVTKNSPFTCAYTMYPRSSISRTPLMMANNTGIIDSGYRGSLIGAFRWLRSENSNLNYYEVEQNTRLLQVCHPTLCPIYVILVDDGELSDTERGTGGFGSTGL